MTLYVRSGKKIDDQTPFFHSMETEKGIARESLLHVTDDGILFRKTVEVKYIVQRIKNMLKESTQFAFLKKFTCIYWNFFYKTIQIN